MWCVLLAMVQLGFDTSNGRLHVLVHPITGRSIWSALHCVVCVLLQSVQLLRTVRYAGLTAVFLCWQAASLVRDS
jgi:hypothetical protein